MNADGAEPLALELRGLVKHYGQLVALNDVSLAVRKGTIHALLGENGAGKTTLMDIAYGLVQPDAGEIRIGGNAIRVTSPAVALAAGIGMVHQHFTLVPAMSVADNLSLGGRGIIRRADLAERLERVMQRTGFQIDARVLVEDLPVSAQQRVEIAKALMGEARMLILDEPTAVLAPLEIEEFLRWLRSFVNEGNAAVLITHKLREAVAVADDVTVLRAGQLTFASVGEPFSIEQLASAMLGQRTQSVEAQQSYKPGDIVLSCEDVTVFRPDGIPALHKASANIRAGELVGVVGVEGSGQRELLRVLAGRIRPTEGSVMRPDVVGFVPEDRHADAVMLDRSLAENLALEGAGRRQGVINWSRVSHKTSALVQAFDVRATRVSTPMRSLSGGNQQKLVLGREITNGSRALVVENPTRGLDIRAASDVRARLRAACAQGLAVVFYSSDVDEVLAIADRVLVLYAGTVREVKNDRELVGRAMLGLS